MRIVQSMFADMYLNFLAREQIWRRRRRNKSACIWEIPSRKSRRLLQLPCSCASYHSPVKVLKVRHRILLICRPWNAIFSIRTKTKTVLE